MKRRDGPRLAALPALEPLPAPVPARRGRWRGASLLGGIGLPTAGALAYYGLIASDVYISEAKFTVRGDQTAPVSAFELPLLGKGGGEDALVVRQYVLSHGIIAELDRRVGLREAYADEGIDYLQRLGAEASSEELTAYFEDMVEIDFDPDSRVTTLRVRAFTPDKAKQIADEVLRLGERLVNSLSERVTGDLLSFAYAQLARAEERVVTAQGAITAFRDRTEALDPAQEAGAILGIISSLETQLAQERAQLMELRSYLREDSARIAATKARIVALTDQIARERARLTGTNGQRLSRVVADYDGLHLELEFARNAYTSMLASLETARAEAQKQQKYLIPVVEPNLPDEALEPKRMLGILTVLLGSLITWGIGALIVAAVREHAEL